MLDIKFIRENLEKVKQGAVDKNINLDFDKLISLDDKRRELIQKTEEMRSEKKAMSKKFGAMSPEERQKAIAEMNDNPAEKELEAELKKVQEDFNYMMLRVPSPASEKTPVGKTDEDNVEIRKWGEVPQFDFEIKSHAELGKNLKMINTEDAVKIAGSRSYFLTGAGAMLEWALLQFTLQSLVKKGYEPQIVPLLVGHGAMEGTSYFPGGEESAYSVGVRKEGEESIIPDEKYLVGTAEVSLTSYHRDKVYTDAELPKKSCALSACFRREAGTYGKDTAGLYRVHQFHKVEQVVVCKPTAEESAKIHAEILQNAEDICQALELPYRVVDVCTGDMGQGQVYKNDIECWMPSRESYGETHSCSTFLDFQARRLNLKYKNSEGKTEIAHTLNNTCIASPRALIPLMEIHQTAEGNINIPTALRPYFEQCGYAGATHITPEGVK